MPFIVVDLEQDAIDALKALPLQFTVHSDVIHAVHRAVLAKRVYPTNPAPDPKQGE